MRQLDASFTTCLQGRSPNNIKHSPAEMQLINESHGKGASPLPFIVLTCQESIFVSPAATVSDRCLSAALTQQEVAVSAAEPCQAR